MPALSRAARLDRLPFTRLHRRMLVIAGAGWPMDAMDVGLISFIMAALAEAQAGVYHRRPPPPEWRGRGLEDAAPA